MCLGMGKVSDQSIERIGFGPKKDLVPHLWLDIGAIKRICLMFI